MRQTYLACAIAFFLASSLARAFASCTRFLASALRSSGVSFGDPFGEVSFGATPGAAPAEG